MKKTKKNIIKVAGGVLAICALMAPVTVHAEEMPAVSYRSSIEDRKPIYIGSLEEVPNITFQNDNNADMQEVRNISINLEEVPNVTIEPVEEKEEPKEVIEPAVSEQTIVEAQAPATVDQSNMNNILMSGGTGSTVWTSDAEIERTKDLIARVVMAEAGNQPIEGKIAVAMTILNRADYHGISIENVISAKDQYTQDLHRTPTNEVYTAIELAKSNRDMFPRNMMYFRTRHYHTFGIPYQVIGDHYFSMA